MTVFYLFWIGLFVTCNVTWDILSKKTPKFHITMLKHKVDILHHAATFCSSLLVVVSVVDEQVKHVATESVIPLIIAGFAGMFGAIPAICPYKFEPTPLSASPPISAPPSTVATTPGIASPPSQATSPP